MGGDLVLTKMLLFILVRKNNYHNFKCNYKKCVESVYVYKKELILQLLVKTVKSLLLLLLLLLFLFIFIYFYLF